MKIQENLQKKAIINYKINSWENLWKTHIIKGHFNKKREKIASIKRKATNFNTEIKICSAKCY